MPSLLDLLLACLVLLGHAAWCVAFVNRSQAIDWPYGRLKILKKITLAFTAFIPLLYLARWIINGYCIIDAGAPITDLLKSPWGYYPAFCLATLAICIPYWLLPKLLERMPPQLVARKATTTKLAAQLPELPLHGKKAAWAIKLPGNQILDVVTEHKQLAIRNLPQELVGLKIAHLSDLHMTGMYKPEFYHWMVEETNRHQPDIVFITGDIAEHPDCIPWIGPTLGKLQAPLGKYYVLGNHDRRLAQVHHLRTALAEADIQNIAGQIQHVTARGVNLLLAGNELPWFGPAPQVAASTAEAAALRILLTHTPDLFPWAKQHRFDLMFAGHNHGGQIRFPLIGALIAPSLYGTKYAGGLYFESPTLLHVSRGLAGVDPLRWNCPPEIAFLELSAEI